MRSLLRSTRFWARAGGAVALLLAGWFAWGLAAEALWRRRTPGTSWIPLDPWPLVNAAFFAAVGVGALRLRDRARPWMLGGGLVTVLLSAVATRVNPWAWAPAALGALLAACAFAWDRSSLAR